MAYALFITLTFDGSMRRFLLYYFVPVSVPFVAFILDRLQPQPKPQIKIDLPVVLLALTRAIYPLPFISGHALFLTYALFSSRMVVTRLAAFCVFLQVAYLKVFAWQDTTILGGVALGLAAYPLPWISGHALFLTYAMTTSRMAVTRLTAFGVFLQVVYLKVFAWQDTTILGGVALGLAAAWIYRRSAALAEATF